MSKNIMEISTATSPGADAARARAAEKQIRTAARLYEIRATAKKLLADKYPETMRFWGKVLTNLMARNGTDEIATATAFCKDEDASAMVVLMVMAAAVELVEPSPPSPLSGATATPSQPQSDQNLKS